MLIIIYSILVGIHGLIHLMGFVKAFEIKEIDELSLPISKKAGIIWIITAVIFIIYTVFLLMASPFAPHLGICSVLVSQSLVFAFWKDAKFGTIPNLIIIGYSLAGVILS